MKAENTNGIKKKKLALTVVFGLVVIIGLFLFSRGSADKYWEEQKFCFPDAWNLTDSDNNKIVSSYPLYGCIESSGENGRMLNTCYANTSESGEVPVVFECMMRFKVQRYKP